jgi:hypothetical protein
MIIAAASTFLLQSWDRAGDVPRYLALLGMTTLLPLVAYACGIRLQEDRSARLLMLTQLALTPIHAGVLGGFVLSQLGSMTAGIARAPKWVAPSPWAALLLVAGAGTILLPLMWASFRVLARPHARLLTLASTAGHALVLLPSRSALAATLTTVSILALATRSAVRLRPETVESRLAVSSLVGPAIVIITRQLFFYEASSVLWGSIFAVGAIALLVLGKAMANTKLERLAVLPTLLSVGAFIDCARGWLELSLSSCWLLFGLASAVPLLVFAWARPHCRTFFVRATVICNAITATSILMIDPRPWAALQCIALGLGLLSHGFVARRRGALWCGIGMASVGFIIEVVHAIEVFQPSAWLALASLGLGLIGLTAWLERRAAKLSQGSSQALSQWHLAGSDEADFPQEFLGS